MPFDISIAALNYDSEAFAQRRCAEELAQMLLEIGISSFIDIGAGTGLAATEVIKKFPKAKSTLIDISPTMLKIARSKFPNAEIISADVEKYSFIPKKLAIANLSIQWFKNFEAFLRKILTYHKYFAFSVPIKGSFKEYLDVFKNIELPGIKLYSEDEILDIVQRNAEIVSTKRLIITQTYQNAIEATRHFKNIGATMQIDAQTQSKISAILKSHKTSIVLLYDLFLCVSRRAQACISPL